MEIQNTVNLGRNKLNSTKILQTDMNKASVLVAFLSVLTDTCQGRSLGGRIYCGTVHPGQGGTVQEHKTAFSYVRGSGNADTRLPIFTFSILSKHPAHENRATHIHAGSFFLGSFSLKITFMAPTRPLPLRQFQIREVSNVRTRCFSHSGLVQIGGYSCSFCLNTIQIIPTKIATGQGSPGQGRGKIWMYQSGESEKGTQQDL